MMSFRLHEKQFRISAMPSEAFRAAVKHFVFNILFVVTLQFTLYVLI